MRQVSLLKDVLIIFYYLMIYRVLHRWLIFKQWYMIIGRGSQYQSTRLQLKFKQWDCAVSLFFQAIRYQIAHIVGYYPILLAWCQIYSPSILKESKYWFDFWTLEENRKALKMRIKTPQLECGVIYKRTPRIT